MLPLEPCIVLQSNMMTLFEYNTVLNILTYSYRPIMKISFMLILIFNFFIFVGTGIMLFLIFVIHDHLKNYRNFCGKLKLICCKYGHREKRDTSIELLEI